MRIASGKTGVRTEAAIPLHAEHTSLSSRLLKKSLRLRNPGGMRDFLRVDAAHF
jgi:hypothetical protein